MIFFQSVPLLEAYENTCTHTHTHPQDTPILYSIYIYNYHSTNAYIFYFSKASTHTFRRLTLIQGIQHGCLFLSWALTPLILKLVKVFGATNYKSKRLGKDIMSCVFLALMKCLLCRQEYDIQREEYLSKMELIHL